MGKLLQFPQPLARQTDVAVNAEGSQGRRQRSQPTPAVTLFTAYLRREKAASESTISNYLLDLEQFQSWLYVANKTFEQAGRRDVQEWLAAKMAEGLTARSAARKLSTLRAFYRLLLDEERIDINPTSRFRRSARAYRTF